MLRVVKRMKDSYFLLRQVFYRPSSATDVKQIAETPVFYKDDPMVSWLLAFMRVCVCVCVCACVRTHVSLCVCLYRFERILC